jgi:hypothetical protein
LVPPHVANVAGRPNSAMFVLEHGCAAEQPVAAAPSVQSWPSAPAQEASHFETD